jgi:hypothetical protein
MLNSALGVFVKNAKKKEIKDKSNSDSDKVIECIIPKKTFP